MRPQLVRKHQESLKLAQMAVQRIEGDIVEAATSTRFVDLTRNEQLRATYNLASLRFHLRGAQASLDYHRGHLARLQAAS